MSKLDKELEEFMRSIRKSNFRQNDPDVTKEKPKAREKSDAADTFEGNKDEVSEDRRPVETPDPYQVEIDKIEQRIKKAKGLTERDMREIEHTLAKQDIEKELFRSRMRMKSEEALEKQRIPRKEPEPELTAKEKFLAKFKSKGKDKGHER